MARRMVGILTGVLVATAVALPAGADARASLADGIPLPGMPHGRCLTAAGAEPAEPVALLCDWGPEQTGAGIKGSITQR